MNLPALLAELPSPLLLPGGATTAWRDPAVVLADGRFHLFGTLVECEADGPYLYLAHTHSADLRHWSPPRKLSPRDRSLNFSSPGNVVRHDGQWVLCCQTYPRPRGERYADESARLWLRRSGDLLDWSEPELLRVKGPDVPREAMGRMIDPYLVADESGRWWCFFKQHGASRAWSTDLRTWTYVGAVPAGENVCLVRDGGEWLMIHSPENGLGLKRSGDLATWRDDGRLTLGQADWPWAQGRLTAGFVLDLRDEPGGGLALLFFHGSRYPEEDPRGGFDNHAGIGLAWSADLRTWTWPGGC